MVICGVIRFWRIIIGIFMREGEAGNATAIISILISRWRAWNSGVSIAEAAMYWLQMHIARQSRHYAVDIRLLTDVDDAVALLRLRNSDMLRFFMRRVMKHLRRVAYGDGIIIRRLSGKCLRAEIKRHHSYFSKHCWGVGGDDVCSKYYSPMMVWKSPF